MAGFTFYLKNYSRQCEPILLGHLYTLFAFSGDTC